MYILWQHLWKQTLCSPVVMLFTPNRVIHPTPERLSFYCRSRNVLGGKKISLIIRPFDLRLGGSCDRSNVVEITYNVHLFRNFSIIIYSVYKNEILAINMKKAHSRSTILYAIGVQGKLDINLMKRIQFTVPHKWPLAIRDIIKSLKIKTYFRNYSILTLVRSGNTRF